MDASSRQLLSERTAHRYRALRFDEPLPALDATTPEELLDAERRYTASKGYEADRVLLAGAARALARTSA